MIYILGFIVSLIFTFLLIKFSYKLNIIDIPNERSIHSKPIPRTGGLGFMLSFFLISLLFSELFYDNLLLFMGIFLVFLLGIYDDFNDVKPKFKFIMIGIATSLIIIDSIQINTLGIYLGFDVSLGYVAIPFTLFAVIGFTNALNLIDGVDGLASGVAAIILLAFFYVGVQFYDILIIYLSLITISVLIGFLFFNWNPAKVFMGDSGSLSLGFIISIIAILSMKYIHPIVILYFLAIPVIDTIIVMIRRKVIGKSPFNADKTHIHHVLLEFFGSAKKTTIFLMMTQSIFCFLGYVVARHIEMYPNGLFPLAMVVAFVILTTMAYMLFTTILHNKGSLNDKTP